MSLNFTLSQYKTRSEFTWAGFQIGVCITIISGILIVVVAPLSGIFETIISLFGVVLCPTVLLMHLPESFDVDISNTYRLIIALISFLLNPFLYSLSAFLTWPWIIRRLKT